MRPRSSHLFLLLAGCSTPAATVDAAAFDAALTDTLTTTDAPRADGGPTNCTEDCRALADACHVAHCNEAAGACVIEDRGGSCDDGDPCTSTDQCLVGTCVGFHIEGCCTPHCAGAHCGDDGCGGSCGTCAAGMLCDAAHGCVAGTVAGDTCASPTEIGSLPFHATASTASLANDYGLPWGSCAGGGGFGQYAPDAVFRFHPLHDGVIMVSLAASGFTGGLYVTTDCADLRYGCVGALAPFDVPSLGPVPVDVHAGVDVFLVVDGDGTTGGAFTLDVTSCAPDCSGAACGADGCLQNCDHQCPTAIEWNCSTARTCVCEGSCTDRVCGSDGCTGSCGICGTGQTCDPHGHCVSTGLPGDTAANAIPITSPFSYSGNTTGYGNDAYLWGACRANVGDSIFHGYDTSDVVFSLAPPIPTTYYLAVTATGFNVSLYALADAADPYSCIEGNYEPATLRNQLLVEASAIDPLVVVVDGDAVGSGPFTLTARACHTAADCPYASAGQFCSWPNVVPSLPFDTTDFRGSLNAYEAPAGTCGSPHALGVDGDDSVYAFTATASGPITARVQGIGQMDPILIVTTDCAALATACVAAADATGENGIETVTFGATAGVTYYVIVDSYGPLGGQLHLTLSAS